MTSQNEIIDALPPVECIWDLSGHKLSDICKYLLGPKSSRSFVMHPDAISHNSGKVETPIYANRINREMKTKDMAINCDDSGVTDDVSELIPESVLFKASRVVLNEPRICSLSIDEESFSAVQKSLLVERKSNEFTSFPVSFQKTATDRIFAREGEILKPKKMRENREDKVQCNDALYRESKKKFKKSDEIIFNDNSLDIDCLQNRSVGRGNKLSEYRVAAVDSANREMTAHDDPYETPGGVMNNVSSCFDLNEARIICKQHHKQPQQQDESKQNKSNRADIADAYFQTSTRKRDGRVPSINDTPRGKRRRRKRETTETQKTDQNQSHETMESDEPDSTQHSNPVVVTLDYHPISRRRNCGATNTSSVKLRSLGSGNHGNDVMSQWNCDSGLTHCSDDVLSTNDDDDDEINTPLRNKNNAWMLSLIPVTNSYSTPLHSKCEEFPTEKSNFEKDQNQSLEVGNKNERFYYERHYEDGDNRNKHNSMENFKNRSRENCNIMATKDLDNDISIVAATVNICDASTEMAIEKVKCDLSSNFDDKQVLSLTYCSVLQNENSKETTILNSNNLYKANSVDILECTEPNKIKSLPGLISSTNLNYKNLLNDSDADKPNQKLGEKSYQRNRISSMNTNKNQYSPRYGEETEILSKNLLHDDLPEGKNSSNYEEELDRTNKGRIKNKPCQPGLKYSRSETALNFTRVLSKDGNNHWARRGGESLEQLDRDKTRSRTFVRNGCPVKSKRRALSTEWVLIKTTTSDETTITSKSKEFAHKNQKIGTVVPIDVMKDNNSRQKINLEEITQHIGTTVSMEVKKEDNPTNKMNPEEIQIIGTTVPMKIMKEDNSTNGFNPNKIYPPTRTTVPKEAIKENNSRKEINLEEINQLTAHTVPMEVMKEDKSTEDINPDMTITVEMTPTEIAATDELSSSAISKDIIIPSDSGSVDSNVLPAMTPKSVENHADTEISGSQYLSPNIANTKLLDSITSNEITQTLPPPDIITEANLLDMILPKTTTLEYSTPNYSPTESHMSPEPNTRIDLFDEKSAIIATEEAFLQEKKNRFSLTKMTPDVATVIPIDTHLPIEITDLDIINLNVYENRSRLHTDATDLTLSNLINDLPCQDHLSNTKCNDIYQECIQQSTFNPHNSGIKSKQLAFCEFRYLTEVTSYELQYFKDEKMSSQENKNSEEKPTEYALKRTLGCRESNDQLSERIDHAVNERTFQMLNKPLNVKKNTFTDTIESGRTDLDKLYTSEDFITYARQERQASDSPTFKDDKILLKYNGKKYIQKVFHSRGEKYIEKKLSHKKMVDRLAVSQPNDVTDNATLTNTSIQADLEAAKKLSFNNQNVADSSNLNSERVDTNDNLNERKLPMTQLTTFEMTESNAEDNREWLVFNLINDKPTDVLCDSPVAEMHLEDYELTDCSRDNDSAEFRSTTGRVLQFADAAGQSAKWPTDKELRRGPETTIVVPVPPTSAIKVNDLLSDGFSRNDSGGCGRSGSGVGGVFVSEWYETFADKHPVLAFRPFEFETTECPAAIDDVPENHTVQDFPNDQLLRSTLQKNEKQANENAHDTGANNFPTKLIPPSHSNTHAKFNFERDGRRINSDEIEANNGENKRTPGHQSVMLMNNVGNLNMTESRNNNRAVDDQFLNLAHDSSGYSVTVHDYAELYWLYYRHRRRDSGGSVTSFRSRANKILESVEGESRGGIYHANPRCTWSWNRHGSVPRESVNIIHRDDVVTCRILPIKPEVEQFMILNDTR